MLWTSIQKLANTEHAGDSVPEFIPNVLSGSRADIRKDKNALKYLFNVALKTGCPFRNFIDHSLLSISLSLSLKDYRVNGNIQRLRWTMPRGDRQAGLFYFACSCLLISHVSWTGSDVIRFRIFLYLQTFSYFSQIQRSRSIEIELTICRRCWCDHLEYASP